MKKILIKTMLVVLCLWALSGLVGCEKPDLWDGSVADGFTCGSGEQSDPYRIASGAELAYLAKTVNAGNNFADCYFELICDVDLQGLDWQPIGTAVSDGDVALAFAGNFYGNGHSIRNLYLHREMPATSSYGLFGALSGRVRSLYVQGDVELIYDASGYGLNAGLIAGQLVHGSVENCKTEGSVRAICDGANVRVGGICGYSDNATLSAVESRAAVESSAHAGGVVGAAKDSVMTDVVAFGNVTAMGKSNLCAGGVCGYDDGSTYLRAVSVGRVKAEGKGACAYAAGTVGYGIHTRIEWAFGFGNVTALGAELNYGADICAFGSDVSLVNAYRLECQFLEADRTVRLAEPITYAELNKRIQKSWSGDTWEFSAKEPPVLKDLL